MFYFMPKLAEDFKAELTAELAANDNIDARKSPRFIKETKYWTVVKSLYPWQKGHLSILAKNSSSGLLGQKKAVLKDFQKLTREIAADLQRKHKSPVVVFCSNSEKTQEVSRFEIMPVKGDFYAACRFLYPDWQSETSLEKLLLNQKESDHYFLGFFLENYECFCFRKASKTASSNFFRRIYDATH